MPQNQSKPPRCAKGRKFLRIHIGTDGWHNINIIYNFCFYCQDDFQETRLLLCFLKSLILAKPLKHFTVLWFQRQTGLSGIPLLSSVSLLCPFSIDYLCLLSVPPQINPFALMCHPPSLRRLSFSCVRWIWR